MMHVLRNQWSVFESRQACHLSVDRKHREVPDGCATREYERTGGCAKRLSPSLATSP